ncbi:hypothetical protein AVEN_212483-1 [Araneus ventricosus]|uniref:Uncharacterized protein n=1 Tax=Araneus ventricosus TaxID=182803 RepID=A0A4Y2K172_ARAVE|nr:hypothetical protein AVEN_212483-1 [Araneus ventricosus]
MIEAQPSKMDPYPFYLQNDFPFHDTECTRDLSYVLANKSRSVFLKIDENGHTAHKQSPIGRKFPRFRDTSDGSWIRFYPIACESHACIMHYYNGISREWATCCTLLVCSTWRYIKNS